MPEITVAELKARLEQEQPLVLVDVREPFEREIADLPDVGQLRMPVQDFEGRLEELDPETPTILYCRTGARSAWATRLLKDRGFGQAVNLRGGVMAWREEIDPTLPAY